MVRITSTPTVRLYAKKPMLPASTRYHRRMPSLRQYRKTAPSTPHTRKYRRSRMHCITCAGTGWEDRPVSCRSAAFVCPFRTDRHRHCRRRSIHFPIRLSGCIPSSHTPSIAAGMRNKLYTAPRKTPKSSACGTALHAPASLASARMACSVAMS